MALWGITSRGRSLQQAQGSRLEDAHPTQTGVLLSTHSLLSRNHINNIIVFHATVSPLPPLLLLQLPLLLQLLLLLLLANYHHCEDHTITQTARYPSVHPTKQTSWQTSTAAEITAGPVITPRPASKTSEMLNISEHPRSRRRLGWHRWRRIFLPSEKINRSRIMSFNTVGSWTQACTNELPQHSSRCPADQWDS